MSETWHKRKQDAEKYRDGILASYEHATISQSHASWVVVYCCPKNVELKALHEKLGVPCQLKTGK